MADEVYQKNIYQSKTPFVSCKKVSSLLTLVSLTENTQISCCPTHI